MIGTKSHRNKRRAKACKLGGSKNPVGYCRLHKLTVSKNQMYSRNCLGKNCRHLQRYKQLPFWEQKEKKKHGPE